MSSKGICKRSIWLSRSTRPNGPFLRARSQKNNSKKVFSAIVMANLSNTAHSRAKEFSQTKPPGKSIKLTWSYRAFFQNRTGPAPSKAISLKWAKELNFEWIPEMKNIRGTKPWTKKYLFMTWNRMGLLMKARSKALKAFLKKIQYWMKNLWDKKVLSIKF